MRIVFSAVPAFGHLLPLVPFVRAAQAQGHAVAVLTNGSMAAPVSVDLPGATFLAAGPDPMQIVAEVARRHPGADPINDPRPETVADFFAGARIDLGYDEALAAARAFQPDLLIVDGADFLGQIVAAGLDVPFAMVAFGPAVPPEFTQPMIATASSRYAERGLEMRPPVAVADPAPRSLQAPDWAAGPLDVPFRPQPHRREEGLETMPRPDSNRPTVLVTLGTVFNDGPLLERILRSVAALDVDMIATLGVQLTDPPVEAENIRYEGFRPLAELLPAADVVVTTGGAGTVLSAASAAVPMVVLPQGADQFLNAARAEAAGIAITTQDADGVGALVTQLLRRGPVQEAARRVAAEIADRPPVDAALERILARA